MAITLNKCAVQCKEAAISGGKITPDSSPRALLYDISREWRSLLDASSFKSDNPGPWSDREDAAGDIMVSVLAYLQHIGCKNIEQLLKDTIERHARQK